MFLSFRNRETEPPDFRAIKIQLASPGAIRQLELRRGHQAGDHQLPHLQAREGRPLLRADLRPGQGLGVQLRQVQAHPLPRHRLRPLRRRGDAVARCAASAWATSSWPCPSRTSGSSRACPAASASCSDMTIKDLERVLYYESYIVIDPGNTAAAEQRAAQRGGMIGELRGRAPGCELQGQRWAPRPSSDLLHEDRPRRAGRRAARRDQDRDLGAAQARRRSSA